MYSEKILHRFINNRSSRGFRSENLCVSIHASPSLFLSHESAAASRAEVTRTEIKQEEKQRVWEELKRGSREHMYRKRWRETSV